MINHIKTCSNLVANGATVTTQLLDNQIHYKNDFVAKSATKSVALCATKSTLYLIDNQLVMRSPATRLLQFFTYLKL